MPRKIVVSGASRGIGLAIGQALIRENYTVIGISRTSSPLRKEAGFIPVNMDITDVSSLVDNLKELVSQHPDISGLINNAGAGLFGSLEEFSVDQIQHSIQLNLLAAIHLTRTFIPVLKQQSRSDILFMGSESALAGARYGSLYSAAKFGLRGFAQSLRHECANSNCHVCMINPGMVRSHFFDDLAFEPGPAAENAISPQEIARVVLTVIQGEDQSIIEEITLNPAKRVVRKKNQSD